MSTTSIITLPILAQNIIIYSGIPIFIAGISGGILNIIVFLSLQTFRQSSCAFYLIIMSIMNIIVLFIGLLANIITAIYGNDGTDISLIYCKIRSYSYHVTVVSSMACLCFATIDQYWATCTYPRLQRWCNIRLAQYLVLSTIFILNLHAIPYLFLFYHIRSSVTGKITCVLTNPIYIQYRLYVNIFIFSGFLPVIIIIIFGLLAYRNQQLLAHRALPIVRRELDKQLTVMVLIQVIISCFAVLPYLVVNIFVLSPNILTDPIFKYQVQIVYSIVLILFYSYFAVSFSHTILSKNLISMFRVHFMYISVDQNVFVDNFYMFYLKFILIDVDKQE